MIEQLSDDALDLLESAAVAIVATINADGSPQLSSAWVTRMRIERISGIGSWRR